ncbi:MAG: magnesium transport protein CorA [Rhodothalassiaceae bacterium]|nr:MAG: magnesium transport protein CorA [Rhodothalassiaceae bacterium]
MITCFLPAGDGRLAARPAGPDAERLLREAVWVDLASPEPAERELVRRALGIDLPTREEMAEIEISSRLYAADHALYMTASVVTGADTPTPQLEPATFIVTAERLVTVRYADSKPFQRFTALVERGEAGRHADAMLLALIDATTDRGADLLERVDGEVAAIGSLVFQEHTRDLDLETMVRRIGRAQTLTGLIRQSLVTLGRLLNFFARHAPRGGEPEIEREIRTQLADVAALGEQAAFLSGRLNFLLDSALGLISLRQNEVIKIFSVMAVIFLPPTLIASIYGMNFQHMPELASPFGYPLALLAMLVSAIAPYLFFKHKGWL